MSCKTNLAAYFCTHVSAVITQDGDVAQLVEQRTENPCVGGSIPSITTLTQAFSFGKAFFMAIVRILNGIFTKYSLPIVCKHTIF